MENTQEIWEVEANGEVFSTSFEEMTMWIDEGSLLRIDRVRKGNLRWIEAGKVPSLIEFFNAKDAAAPPPRVVSTTTTEILGVAEPTQQFVNSPTATPNSVPAAAADSCAMHPDAPAAYVCDTCSNSFCKACPSSYGGTVKICPFCGAMCKSLAEAKAEVSHQSTATAYSGEKFGFNDFGRALAYPFKFKTSLIMGAFMYAFVSIGQGAMSFGGIYMMGGALACFLLGNTLTFGILAHTVENFSQGKIGDNFMPTFDDFSIWDDVVHPFFLGIGVYIVSFGPLIALAAIAFFVVLGPVTKQMNGLQSDAARTVSPEAAYAPTAIQQGDKIKELARMNGDAQKRRIEAMERANEEPELDREIQPDQSYRTSLSSSPEFSHNPSAVKLPSPTPIGGPEVDPEEEYFNRTNKMIADTRKSQLEATIGKTPETKAAERAALIKQILGYGVVFLLLGGLCLLWGTIYFPAACAVAGYTRSFTATINPSVGFDTIKHLGVDYLKILLMVFLIGVMSTFVSGILNSIFFAFDMPSVGNIPARFLGSILGFYLSIVFACLLGFALFKNADRLKLYR